MFLLKNDIRKYWGYVWQISDSENLWKKIIHRNVSLHDYLLN